MKKYGDIIKRIEEIISLSNKRKVELGNELNSENYNDYFVRIFWKDIVIEYADEFEQLLDSERTFYLIQTSSDMNGLTKFNNELKEICQVRGSEDNDFTDHYLRLLEIINNSEGKTAFELSEINGYYIPREELNEFIWLCRLLKVGPYQKLKDMDTVSIKNIIQNNLNNKIIQDKRIKEGFKFQNSKNKEINVESTEPEDNIYNPQSYLRPDRMFDKKETYFKELVYLGITGDLTPKAVINAKNILTDSEFDLLLEDLSNWSIFSAETIEQIRISAYYKEKKLSCIDNLIPFLISRGNLNFNSLETLIPFIGKKSYHMLVDKLFKYGLIDFETYKSYLDKVFSLNFEKK